MGRLARVRFGSWGAVPRFAPVWVPDAAHEALRDLVRAREAAKQDQLRARHRLGQVSAAARAAAAAERLAPWTQRHLAWITHQVHFAQAAQEATLLDYLHEVEHAAERVARLERAIDAAIGEAPPRMRAVIDALAGAAGDREGLGGDDRRPKSASSRGLPAPGS